MSNNCHGFVKNKSILTNALPHIGARVLMKFDFENFFPSIKLHNVISQFRFFTEKTYQDILDTCVLILIFHYHKEHQQAHIYLI